MSDLYDDKILDDLSPEMLEAGRLLTEVAINRDPGDCCGCEQCS